MRGELEGLFCCGLIWVALEFRVYECVWLYLDIVNQQSCGEMQSFHCLAHNFLQMNFALWHSDQAVSNRDCWWITNFSLFLTYHSHLSIDIKTCSLFVYTLLCFLYRTMHSNVQKSTWSSFSSEIPKLMNSA